MIHYLSSLNRFDQLILIYGTPLLIFLISLMEPFSPLQKLSLVILGLVLILGFNYLQTSLQNKNIRRDFKKRRYAMKDLNYKLLNIISPRNIIFLALSSSIGGILCFFYIEQNLNIYLFGTLIFFIIIKGGFNLISDLYNQSELNSIKLKLISFIHSWFVVVFLFCLGAFIGYKIYSTEISNIILSGIIFALFSKTKFLIKITKPK